MRTLILLVAALVAATNSGAQVPLTIDTSFHFYYSAELMDYWSEHYAGGNGMWTPNIGDVLLRNNGNVLATGNDLIKPLHEVPWGGQVSVEFAAYGDGSVLQYGPSCTSGVLEIPGTDMWYSNNSRRFNDCSDDHSFGWPDLYIANPDPGGYHVFSDSTVLITGYFRISQSDPLRYTLIKVDKWGELDITFAHCHATLNGGTDVNGKQIRQLSNGQFLFNGRWTHYQGRPVGRIIRINADGSQDTTFHTSIFSSEMNSMYEQPDGKVVLGGMFRFNDLPDTLNLVRLNIDGSLDQTFNNFNYFRTGYFGPVSAMPGVKVVPLDAGRLFVGGAFTRVGDVPRSYIACVDTAGNLLDCWENGGLQPMNYTAGGWPNGGCSGLRTLANGETYIYGMFKGFTDANGYHPDQVCVSRLYMPHVGVEEKPVARAMLRVWPNPGTNTLHLDMAGYRLLALELRDALGRTVLERSSLLKNTPIDVSSLAPGTYVVLARTAQGERLVANWVKQ